MWLTLHRKVREELDQVIAAVIISFTFSAGCFLK